MATATTATTTKRHPIRGFLYGIPFGLGLAMIAIGQKWAALGTWPPFIIFVVGIVASMAWGMFGPAKKPKGPEPVAAGAEEPPVETEPAEEPPVVIQPPADAATADEPDAGEPDDGGDGDPRDGSAVDGGT